MQGRMATSRYRIYGSLDSKQTIALSSVLLAKGLAADLIEQNRSLALLLAARSGEDRGPYLRTPDGFVLGNLHAILEWIERVHPDPALVPTSPVRRICARMLEDWIECWLPLWPRRSWSTLFDLGAHLVTSGSLLGGAATRADWMLAAWLEAEVLIRSEARDHLARHAPALLDLGNRLIAQSRDASSGSSASTAGDDAIPISLLGILEDLARDYHLYLTLNQSALKDREDRVAMDLGLGLGRSKCAGNASGDASRSPKICVAWIRRTGATCGVCSNRSVPGMR